MPPRITQTKAQGRCFIREWRFYRDDISQDRLVERMRERLDGISKSSLSRIENGLQPYSQPILEAAAWALNCEPADLLRPPPTNAKSELDQFLRRLDAKSQERALRVLRAALMEEAA